jgi:hypothetical protein
MACNSNCSNTCYFSRGGRVIDVIDIQALRHTESSYHSPAKWCKLVLDEFQIAFGRKVLSAGEKE